MVIKNFFLMPKAMRRGITDPILLRSGKEILSGTVAGITASVKVVGEVDVTYKEEDYKDPEDFPEELVKYIKSEKNIFAPEKPNPDLEIVNNNWYELHIDCGSRHLYDEVVEIELPALTVKEAREYILSVLRPYLEQLAGYRRYSLFTWPDSQMYVGRKDCYLIDPESDRESYEGNDPTALDSAYMVPSRSGDYALTVWPESQTYQERKGVLTDYDGRTFVPVDIIV